MKVSDQLSLQSVFAFAAVGVVVLTFLFASVVLLSPIVMAQQHTPTNTTTTITGGIIPDVMDLPQQQLLTVVVDDEPFYQSTSSERTGLRIVDASPSSIIRELSYVEKGFMRNIGNVTNTVTFVNTVNQDLTTTVVHGAGKGIITTENGDTISWISYGLGLPAGYGNSIDNDTGTSTTAGGLNTYRVTTYRGIAFFSTDSERLSFMNNVVGLYISQVNEENGSSLRQMWEWRNNY